MSDLNGVIESLEAELEANKAAFESEGKDETEATIADDATVGTDTSKPKDKKPEAKEEAKTEDVKEEGSPSEPDKTEEDSKVPLRALEDERRKRQELERQLQAIQEHLQKQQTPKQEKIDLLDDPEARLEQMEAELNTKMLIQRVEMSEYMARQQYEDYDEISKRFMEEASKYPALVDQMKTHPAPAIFAYEQGSKFKQLDEMESLDSYKESLSEKIRKEIEEEVRAKYEAKGKKAKDLPKSISDKSSASISDDEKPIDVDSFIKNSGWTKK